MYRPFNGLTNRIEIVTDLRLLLADPSTPDPEFTVIVEAQLQGEMTVQIGRTFLTASGLHVLPWFITSMDQSGDSRLGTIRAHNNPVIQTHGIVAQKFRSAPFPADLGASVFQDVTVPGYGSLTLATPVHIAAEITSIPPLNITALHRTPGTLVDGDKVVQGMVDGRSITLLRSLP